MQGAAWGACLLGASGTVAWLWRYGPDAQRGAIMLALGAVGLELALRCTPPRWRVVAVALVAGLLELATVSLVGETPALLMSLSVLVADAALVDWAPSPSWPTRRTRTAGLAIPLVVLAQVVWFRSGSIWPTAVLLALGLVVVESYHRFPAQLAAADSGFRAGLLRLANGAAAALLFLVALPVVYLPGALGRLGGFGRFGRRRRGERSSWQAVQLSAVTASQEAALPFISPSRSTRRRRHLTGLLVLAAMVVALAVAPRALDRSGLEGDPPQVAEGGEVGDARTQLDLLEFVPYSERPAMADQPFADELQRDLAEVQLVPRADTGYATADTRSTLVNVVGGERRTATAACPGCPTVSVWLVGASTVFGVGQRDSGTIASELVRLAAAEGIALDIRNLGVVGWTSHQEVTDVIAKLDAGEAPPDMVVMVDGFNDAMASVAREYAGRGDDDAPLVFEDDAALAVLESEAALGDEGLESAARRAAAAYRSEQRRLLDALEPSGTELAAFFQPDAFASERQIASVRPLYDDVPALLERTDLGDVAARTSKLLSAETTDLRHLYDDVDEPLFIDMVHTNERGAALVAAAVHSAIGRRVYGG